MKSVQVRPTSGRVQAPDLRVRCESYARERTRRRGRKLASSSSPSYCPSSRGRSTRSPGTTPCEPCSCGVWQGLPLVHFSAHPEPYLWDSLGDWRVSGIKMTQVELSSGRVYAPGTWLVSFTGRGARARGQPQVRMHRKVTAAVATAAARRPTVNVRVLN
jgi:hypothetical protein